MDWNQLVGGADIDIPQIKLRPVEELVPYARNSRTHSAKQIEQLQSLILEFGFTNAVLIDEQGMVAGHGRTMAVQAIYKRGGQIRFPNGALIPIGYIPTMDCSGWTPQQRKAYIIADNRSALSAGWDEEMLHLELKELEAAEYDLTLTAFDEDEIAELLAGIDVEEPVFGDPDALPEEPAVPVSKPGDVWICGDHRVMCGDATSMDDWDRLMGSDRAAVCWTGPPYNVDVGLKNQRMDAAVGGNRSGTGKISGDKLRKDAFADLLRGIYGCLYAVMQPGAAIYVAHSDKEGLLFRQLFEEAGFHFSQGLVWKKNNLVVGMADYQPIHEPILYGWKTGKRHRWKGGRKQVTVAEYGDGSPFRQLEDGRWSVRIGDQVLIVAGDAVLEEAPGSVLYEPKPDRSGLHPTQKPVELVERMLANSAMPGEIVVDACGGSGTTLVAAERIGMRARIMEVDPKFADVIVRRWQDITGKKASHAVTGVGFSPEAEPDLKAQSAPVETVLKGLDSNDIF